VAITRQFAQFVQWLPENYERNGFDRNDLLFVEYVEWRGNGLRPRSKRLPSRPLQPTSGGGAAS
jgi:hypothetical protein